MTDHEKEVAYLKNKIRTLEEQVEKINPEHQLYSGNVKYVSDIANKLMPITNIIESIETEDTESLDVFVGLAKESINYLCEREVYTI